VHFDHRDPPVDNGPPTSTRRSLVTGLLGTALGQPLAPRGLAEFRGGAAQADAAGEAQPALGSRIPARSNVVLLVLDDLDSTMLDEALPHLPTLGNLQQSGATFSQFVVTTPLCSPSRATLLRGQYAHNHGVLQNRGNKEIEEGFPLSTRRSGKNRRWRRGSKPPATEQPCSANISTTCRSALHQPMCRPAGTSGSRTPTTHAGFYFDYTFNENGTLRYYGSAAEDYSTDVLAAKSANFVRQSAARGQPFFLYVAPYAPHDPAVRRRAMLRPSGTQFSPFHRRSAKTTSATSRPG
jgi:hypothetical protein